MQIVTWAGTAAVLLPLPLTLPLLLWWRLRSRVAEPSVIQYSHSQNVRRDCGPVLCATPVLQLTDMFGMLPPPPPLPSPQHDSALGAPGETARRKDAAAAKRKPSKPGSTRQPPQARPKTLPRAAADASTAAPTSQEPSSNISLWDFMNVCGCCSDRCVAGCSLR